MVQICGNTEKTRSRQLEQWCDRVRTYVLSDRPRQPATVYVMNGEVLPYTMATFSSCRFVRLEIIVLDKHDPCHKQPAESRQHQRADETITHPIQARFKPWLGCNSLAYERIEDNARSGHLIRSKPCHHQHTFRQGTLTRLEMGECIDERIRQNHGQQKAYEPDCRL